MTLPGRLSPKQMLALKTLHDHNGYMDKENFNEEIEDLYGGLEERRDRQRLSSMLSRLYDRNLVTQVGQFGYTHRTTHPEELKLTEQGEEVAEEIERRNQDGRYDLDLDQIRELQSSR